MFRDRTNLYLSYRKTYPHCVSVYSIRADQPDTFQEEESLIGLQSQINDVEMSVLAPSFLEIGQKIDDVIDEITDLGDKLSALYKKNILPGFNDRSIDEEEIQRINYDITSKLSICNSLTRKLGEIKKNPKLSSDNVSLIDNMQKSYAMKIQQLSSSSRKFQNTYIHFLKKDGIEQIPNIKSIDNSYNPALDDDAKEVDLYSREIIKESSSILQQSSPITDTLIKKRERDIIKLAHGMLEVSNIFKEMQNMVIEQGTILDRVDYYIERTKMDLQGTTNELTTATTYQNRTHKCKIILLLSLIALLLFVIVITKPQRHIPEDLSSDLPSDSKQNQMKENESLIKKRNKDIL